MTTNLYIRSLLISGLLGLLINNGFSKTFINDVDSVNINNPSVVDSSNTIPDSTQIIKRSKSSPNAPETIVKYFADDSIIMDNTNNIVRLYHNAKVEYGEITLEADTITIYLSKNELYAKHGIDSLGNMKKVHFKDGEEEFFAPAMRYNFNTKKGKIYEITTQESDMYLLANIAKRTPSEDIFIKKGKITTCDAPDPHFYFLSEKLKVRPGKYIVSGPTHLVIRGIHTPIWVPFGIFPSDATKKSGILIPGPASDRGQQGLRELGYHWAINDYVHAEVLTDIFFSGLFRLNTRIDYKKRYKYNGSFGVNYNRLPSGTRGLDDYSLTEDYSFIWKHSQDPKAHPKSRFNINIDAKTPSFNQTQNLNSTTAFNSVQSYNRSNISWGWNDSWGSIQTSADFNQDFGRNQVTARAPNISLRTNNKKIIGNFQFRTNIEMRNEVSGADSTFYQAETLNKINSGARANTVFDFGGSYRIPYGFLRYINLTVPSLTINTYANIQTIRQSLDIDGIERDTVRQLRGAYDMSLGNFRMNTKIFGTFKFRDGMYIKGIRHTIDPTVSLTWNPDFFIDLQDINRALIDSMGQKVGEYSIYGNSMFRPTASNALLLNYSLNNVLQAKIRQRGDTATTYKNTNIIQAFNVTGNYNFLADSLQWSDLRFNINANPGFLKTFNIDAVVNPYEMDSSGNSVNKLLWEENNIGRLVNFNVRTAIGFGRKDFIPKTRRDAVMKDGFNWTLNINYTFSYRKPGLVATLNNTLGTSGNVTFNEKWGFSYMMPIDLETYNIAQNASLSFNRDLHCWVMSVDWLPFNPFVNYTFTIRPKAGLLSDLKYEKRTQGQQPFF